MDVLPIKIPENFQVQVSVGDRVTEGQVLAKKINSENLDSEKINIARLLKVSPKKSIKYLQKNPGDFISVGDVVAKKNGLLNKYEIISNVEGSLIKIERDTGEIFITKDRLKKEVSDITSPIDGEIIKCNNNEIEISGEEQKVQEEKIVPEVSIGGSVVGVMHFISPDKGQVIEGVDLSAAVIGSIILCYSISKEAVAKAASIGVLGILAVELPEDIHEYLETKKMIIPVLNIDNKSFENLKKSSGRIVNIDSENKNILVKS